MARRFDRQDATADARFERLEDQAAAARRRANPPADDPDTEAYGVSERELSDMHVTDGDSELPDDDQEHVMVEADVLVDALSEVFNARDLEGVMDLCQRDCEVPGLTSGLDEVGLALDDLWVRRPTVTMTRIVDDGTALGVLWERVASEEWGTVGTVHLAIDGELVSVMEFSDAVEVIDRRNPEPPDGRDPMWHDPDEPD